MPSLSVARLAPLTGVVAVALTVVMFIVVGEPPDVRDKSSSEIVEFWDNNKHIAGAVMLTLAGAFFVWFGGSLRTALWQAERPPGRVSTICFAGFVLFGLSFALFGGVEIAAAETAGDVPPEVTHTLATLDMYLFMPAVLGQFLAMAAAAVVILRHGGLPRWLGYVSIVIAIVLMTPVGFFGFVAVGVWVLIVSVLLFLREDATAPER
ncbi:hypothetical protein [Streptomyces alkaliterrae]|uniref:DUF4386 family protein n=1 Tax=Streptomyces alkaliterrae TaxID=2213162 RepID=A0A5P0YL62_9ACTN|nr:hypothetical protein [Streptomyces alkaliterrae]MBB1259586.1 hypothetical protein [Streptomyces alkaliterrae]MQS00988.1 hypothetical protein [Streptomyces alkaliterrae]